MGISAMEYSRIRRAVDLPSGSTTGSIRMPARA